MDGGTREQAPVWLDVDAGIDDGLGLMLALSDPSAHVCAVSCCHGNTDVRQVASNVARVLALCGRSASVPIFVGASEPLVRPARAPPAWYGKDGFGDEPHVRPRAGDDGVPGPAPGAAAAEELVKCAAEHEGELQVVALGPLTNLALALSLDPALPSRLRQLVIMGSGGRAGSSATEPEFNFQSDPEAAAQVLDAFAQAAQSGRRASAVLVSWGLAEEHPVPWSRVEAMLSGGGSRARFVSAISARAIESSRRSSPLGWALADPLAVAVALQPSLVTASEQVHVEVETQGGASVAGLAVFNRSKDGNRNVQLVTVVDQPAFICALERSLDG